MSKNNNHVILRYLVLPFIFLTVTLLGGMRLSTESNEFIFLKPALICLIFATILFILLFKAKILSVSDWFSENFSTLTNLVNGFILLTLFAATTQIFNALLPEKGLAFWIIGFFFFWTLWNNLFVDFKSKRLLQSLGSLFGLAFVVKYLILASLTVSSEQTWTQKILEGLMKEASFGLLDLPKFSAATGYIQFFTLAIYSLGLLLLSSFATFVKTESPADSSEITS